MDFETYDNLMHELNDAIISLDNASSMLGNCGEGDMSDELRRFSDRVFEIYGYIRRNY